jgi:hypothetical protein
MKSGDGIFRPSKCTNSPPPRTERALKLPQPFMTIDSPLLIVAAWPLRAWK